MTALTLPEIEFDGKIVKPTGGKYKCPYRCQAKGYPVPSWKTVKGIKNHLMTCLCSPAAIARKASNEASMAEQARIKGEVEAARLGLKIGDEIFYVTHTVTAPTHVQRFGRLVRVRYEELRNYYGARGRIESFGWAGTLVINGYIAAQNLCSTHQEALDKAAAAQAEYAKHLEFSAAVR